MKSTFRNYPRLISMWLLVCLTALVALVPGGQSTYAQHSKAQQPDAPVGSGFTYQGRLKDGGNPANGSYDLQFTLYDALTGGNQVGTTQTLPTVSVSEGLFTVTLDFGASAFAGQARWLGIAVRHAGGGSYTPLSPRQPLTAVPYAQSLATGSTGAVITGTVAGPALSVTNGSGTAVYASGNTSNGSGVLGIGNVGVEGRSTSNIGVYGDSVSYAGVYGSGGSASGFGVYGYNNVGVAVRGFAGSQHGGLFTNNSNSGYAALQGIASGTPGYGIYGEGNSIGIWGSTTNGTGVRGATTGGYGVHGYSTGNGTGVRGESPGGNGVYGLSTSGSASGVSGENTSTTGYGVYGVNTNGANARGVVGYSSGVGTYGTGTGQSAVGVYGASNGTTSYGVYGKGAGNNAISIYGWGGTGVWAGYFSGDIYVAGTCWNGCLGPSKIDHPLDPENKYLTHAPVESSDMLDIYTGNVTTDSKGEATVVMPNWFEAMNRDFRYQLTIMSDDFAQARVSNKMKNNRFVVKTDKPNIEVSWLVTATRNDPYSRENAITVEEEKQNADKGKYLHPEAWGQPESQGIGYEQKKKMESVTAPPSNP